MGKEISPEELKQRLEEDRDIHLLDVREQYEYDEGHIEGCSLIPVGDLTDRIDEIKDWQGDKIVAYCRSGNRSAMTQQLLNNEGFEQVYNLTGGFEAWEELER